MFKKNVSIAALVLLVALLAGCVPTSARVPGADAGTPTFEVSQVQVIPTPEDATVVPEPMPTEILASATVSVPMPNEVLASATMPAPIGPIGIVIPATVAVPPPYSSNPPGVSVAAVSWVLFNSPRYNYAVVYPSDWTVSVENPGTIGEARQIETVIFKQPNYGSPNHFSAVTLQAAQHGYATTGQCQNPTEVVPGIRGCRRSMPSLQNLSQELVWFQPLTYGQEQLYIDVQLVYDDLKYVTAFNHMLQMFKYTGAPTTTGGNGACIYKASFLGDVTIPDNTVLAPGVSFTKTWRVRNDSTCAWGYAGSALHRLVFVGGDRLAAPTSLELPFPELGQGGTVDISVPMVAPLNPGTYRSNWRFQVDNGPQVGVGPSGDTPLYAQIVVPGAATPTAMPPPTWKTYTSSKYHYVVNYPANWTIDVQTPGYSGDPENVYLRPAPTGLPTAEILALKGAPPIKGFENCDKNLQIKGVLACSLSLPKGQIPATRLLIFQKGDSYYHLSMEYEVQQQLAVFEEIVKSFQFTQ
jgi:hypothetical protein